MERVKCRVGRCRILFTGTLVHYTSRHDYIVHRPSQHNSHAPSGRDPFGSRKLETDVCMRAPYRI
jgi:hypothetical protein